jgi:hypothetical protein
MASDHKEKKSKEKKHDKDREKKKRRREEEKARSGAAAAPPAGAPAPGATPKSEGKAVAFASPAAAEASAQKKHKRRSTAEAAGGSGGGERCARGPPRPPRRSCCCGDGVPLAATLRCRRRGNRATHRLPRCPLPLCRQQEQQHQQQQQQQRDARPRPSAQPTFDPRRDGDTTLAAFRGVKPPGGPDRLQPCWPLEGAAAAPQRPLASLQRVLDGKAELWVLQLPAQVCVVVVGGGGAEGIRTPDWLSQLAARAWGRQAPERAAGSLAAQLCRRPHARSSPSPRPSSNNPAPA